MAVLTETFAPLRRSISPVASLPVQRRRREAAADLAEILTARIAGEVRFDPASRALYATDLSIYRQVPIGVVIPKDIADVEATVEACRARDVPILGRGCGTSLSGQTCNVAVVIDFSKYMNRILALDPDGRRARVQPGVINDEVRKAAHKHGLTYRARSRDARLLHARRQYRQQLLRRAHGHGRQDRRQCRGARHPDL